jgi:hypothetical protein
LALAVGALIVFSAGLLWLNVHITSISSIAARLMAPVWGDALRRLVFLTVLTGGMAIYHALRSSLQTLQFKLSTFMIVLAGHLVSFGTGLDVGCTSGHGVCGLSRQLN